MQIALYMGPVPGRWAEGPEGFLPTPREHMPSQLCWSAVAPHGLEMSRLAKPPQHRSKINMVLLTTEPWDT